MSPSARAGRRETAPRRMLPVVTFEAGRHLMAIPASEVVRIVPWGAPLPEGTALIDAAALLAPEGTSPERACVLLLESGGGPPLGLTARRAREVRDLDPEKLLPLPAFIFRGANPFVGVAVPGPADADRAVFLLAGASRLAAAAADA